MTKTGIVFSGGGGKGAYEIGVWKALKEFGFDQDITAVSGTSVGGLNAALFVQGDYKKAEKLWLNITPSQILKLNSEDIVKQIIGGAASLAIPGLQGRVALQLASAFSGKGLFTQKGLQQLITESGVCNTLGQLDIPLYVCTLKLPQGKLQYTDITKSSEEDTLKWLKATSAIPIIYPSIVINDQKYCDGGVLPSIFQDNTPYQPLIDNHGCTHIINIYLDRHPDTRSSQLNNPNVKFWNLIPNEKFHGIIESLNFTPENVQVLIDCGYDDTKAILERFAEFLKTEERYIDSVSDFSESSHQFKQQINISKKLIEGDTFFKFLSLENKQQACDEVEASEILVKPESFDEIMSNLNAELSQQEQKIIAQNTDSLIEEMKDSSAELLEEAFLAITALASTDGRINSQFEQGVMGRLIGGVTGSNAKQQASVNLELNHSIYATQTLIQKLNHKQMLSMEAIASLSNKTNYLMTHINLLNGKLQQQNQVHHNGLLMLKNGLSALAKVTDQRFNNLEERVDNIEYNQAMNNWYHRNRHQVNETSATHALLTVTADFYTITGGNWTDNCLNRYQSLLEDLKLSRQEIQWQECLQDTVLKPFIEVLSERSIFPVEPKKRAYHSLLTQMQCNYEKSNLQLTETDKIIRMNGKELGLTLLHSLQRNDAIFAPKLSKKMNNKKALLGVLTEISNLNTQIKLSDSILKETQYLIEKVNAYKVIIPLIGKFSAGKSSLLNTYLGEDLLKWDINPETSVATELLYAETPKVLLHYKNGDVVQHSKEILETLPETDDLLYIQYFINNIKLKHRQKITIVDMPGFDSNLEAHHKAIATYMCKGDLFINVFPADIPFDDSIMQYLSEITYDYDKPVHCLLSKCARFSSKVLNDKKSELVAVLESYVKTNEQGKVVVGELESKDNDKINIDSFEDLIDNAVVQNEQYLFSRLAPGVNNLVKSTIKELTTQLSLSHSDEATLNEKIKIIETDFLQIKKKLERETIQFEHNLNSTGKEAIVLKVTTELSNSIEHLFNAAKSNRLNQTINTMIRPIVQFELTQLIESELDKLQQNLASITISECGDVAVQILIPESEKEKFSLSTSAICAGIGTLVLGPLAGVVSALIGGLFGRKDNEQEKEQQIKAQIQNQVIPTVIEQVMNNVDQQLLTNINELKDRLEQSLQSQKETYSIQINELLLQKKESEVTHSKLLTLYKTGISTLNIQQEKLVLAVN